MFIELFLGRPKDVFESSVPSKFVREVLDFSVELMVPLRAVSDLHDAIEELENVLCLPSNAGDFDNRIGLHGTIWTFPSSSSVFS